MPSHSAIIPTNSAHTVLGNDVFHAVWTFKIVYTSSCNFLVEYHVEFLYHFSSVCWLNCIFELENTEKIMSVSPETQYIIWLPPSKLFILYHKIIIKKLHKGLFGETAVTKCLVTAWSPAWDSLNSQWLQGTKLTPTCWPFEMLALKSAQRVRCHTVLQNLPMPFLFKGEPEKSSLIPDGGRSRQQFIYLLQLKFGRRLCIVEGSFQEAILTCRTQ